MGKKIPSLTPKQAAFVQEYLVDLNGAAAAARAGYSGRTAKEIAAENLTKPHIAAAIAEAQAARSRRTEITQDWVLERLRAEALFDGEGASHGARIRAVELCGKHLGMFVERSEVTVEDRRPERVRIVHGTRGAGTSAPLLEKGGTA
jgi:phage terminase small subunit